MKITTLIKGFLVGTVIGIVTSAVRRRPSRADVMQLGNLDNTVNSSIHTAELETKEIGRIILDPGK